MNSTGKAVVNEHLFQVLRGSSHLSSSWCAVADFARLWTRRLAVVRSTAHTFFGFGDKESAGSCLNVVCAGVARPDTEDCVVGDWLDWEPCSVSCGNGTTQRTRSVQPPASWEG